MDDDVLSALRASSDALLPHVERVRKNPDDLLIKMDWSKTVDRDALHTYRHVVKELLLRNSTGIFRKLVVKKGLVRWDKELGGVIAKVPSRMDTTAMSLVALVQMVTGVKKCDDRRTHATMVARPRFVARRRCKRAWRRARRCL